MFEAGVRSGDTLCILNPCRPQDNFVGSRLTVLRSMHAKGITRVDMTGINEPKQSGSFEEISYKSPIKDADEETKQSPAKGGIFSRLIPKFTGFTTSSANKEKTSSQKKAKVELTRAIAIEEELCALPFHKRQLVENGVKSYEPTPEHIAQVTNAKKVMRVGKKSAFEHDPFSNALFDLLVGDRD